ncbi:MAG TPA: Gfo/Idh/MocA family oxidoreductase [Trebonia sp.]
MTIPVVMIGTGDWARDALGPALRSIPEVEVVACASPDTGQAARFAAAFGIPRTYAGLDDALTGEPRVGLLVVSTPDDHHAVALRRAVDAGIPVFCEKPVANSAEDAEELARRVLASPVPATVGFSFRYSTAVQRLRDDLRSGHLGDPWLVELAEHNPQFHPVVGRPLNWKGDPAHAAGGAVFEYGAHVVDLGCWLLGEVAEVSAQFATVVPGAVLDDIAVLQLRYRSGVLGTVTTSWVLGGGFPGITVRVHGSAGRGEVFLGAEPQPQERYVRRDATGAVAESLDLASGDLGKSARVARQLADFAAAVTGGTQRYPGTLPTLESSAHVQRVLDTALRAAGTGLPVVSGER